AELVERIRKLGEDVFKGAKYALAQLQIVNPNVKFTTEGIGMLRKVVDGQIVIPDKYKQMEMEDEEEEVEEGGEAEDGCEEGNQEGFEEGQGESDG
ncbi:hypothetical protein A2U01_0072703, partial [Trifolium medium]|nr:hypothetical protein [Trifolium medium]